MDALARHLTERYGVRVERVARLDEDVFRMDGPSWVAGRFPAGTNAAAAATAAALADSEVRRVVSGPG